MALPRPAPPRVLWSDLKAFARLRPRHQWVAATLAVLIPVAVLTVFYFDGQTNILPREQIIYVDSWSADRSDAEIIAKQKRDLVQRQEAEAERRRQFQRIDSNLNRLGI